MSRANELRAETLHVSRRSFISRSSLFALFVAFPAVSCGAAPQQAASGARTDRSVNVWVTFRPDGSIEIKEPVTDMGTGTSTAIAMYVAEELDADWNDVRIVTAPNDEKVFGNPYFSNWQIAAGVRTTLGYYHTLRVAGAQARRLLLTAAALRWSVPIEELTTENSVVHDRARGRQLRYADLVADVVVPDVMPEFVDLDFVPQVFDIYFGEPPASPFKPDSKKPHALPLKRRADFKLIGAGRPRIDVPAKSRGQTMYGIDTVVEEMLFAMVLVAPKLGGLPDKIDDKAARAVNGIVDILKLPYGVAVVGRDIFSVREARELLNVSWQDAPVPVVGYSPTQKKDVGAKGARPEANVRYDSTKTLANFLDIARKSQNLGPVFAKGDAGEAQAWFEGKASEPVSIKAFESQSELVYHAPIEPQNAVVHVAPDKGSAKIWVGTQWAMVEAFAVAGVLGISPDKVEVLTRPTGGAFGRRAEAGAVIDGAHISAQLGGKPVKVLWTREDDLRRNPHRMALASRMEAAIDRTGKIRATRQAIVADSWLARVMPDSIGQMGGSDINNWSGAINTYDIPHQTVVSVMERRAVDVCFMRGIAVLHNKFCQEGLIDQIALESALDPLQFRLNMLEGEPRAQVVLREVAAMAEWSRKRTNRELGIALGDYPGAHVAAVAEVSLDRKSGEIKVHKIWCAVDVGMAVNPDGIVAQVEGGIVMAVSMALKEKVSVVDNLVQNTNFSDYPIIRMSETPDVEVKVISTSSAIAGAGEIGMYPVAPAINAAVARIIGKHLHRMPMLPEDVLKIVRA